MGNVIRPDRSVVIANQSGVIASMGGAGVAFRLEPSPTDASNAATTPGGFPVDVVFDQDTSRTYRMTQPGLEVLGGDPAQPAFTSLGAKNCTPGGAYLCTVYKQPGQGALAVDRPRSALLWTGTLQSANGSSASPIIDCSEFAAIVAEWKILTGASVTLGLSAYALDLATNIWNVNAPANYSAGGIFNVMLGRGLPAGGSVNGAGYPAIVANGVNMVVAGLPGRMTIGGSTNSAWSATATLWGVRQ